MRILDSLENFIEVSLISYLIKIDFIINLSNFQLSMSFLKYFFMSVSKNRTFEIYKLAL